MEQYYVIVNKQQHGPMDEDSLVEGFRAGFYPVGSLAWCAEMPEWLPIETLPMIAPLLADSKPADTPDIPSGTAAPAQPKKRRWGLYGGIAASVAVVLALCYVVPRYFTSDSDDAEEKEVSRPCESDADVFRFMEERIAAVEKFDAKTAGELRKAMPELKKDFASPSGMDECGFAAIFAASGEKNIVKYLFNKKGYGMQAAECAYIAAAAGGHVDVMKFLIGKVGNRAELNSVAFCAACATGQVAVCKYLVDECGLDLENLRTDPESQLAGMLPINPLAGVMEHGGSSFTKEDVFRNLAFIPGREYQKMAMIFSVLRGSEVNQDTFMAGVAEVAKYLKAKGARLDISDTELKGVLMDCPNAALKKLLAD